MYNQQPRYENKLFIKEIKLTITFIVAIAEVSLISIYVIHLGILHDLHFVVLRRPLLNKIFIIAFALPLLV